MSSRLATASSCHPSPHEKAGVDDEVELLAFKRPPIETHRLDKELLLFRAPIGVVREVQAKLFDDGAFQRPRALPRQLCATQPKRATCWRGTEGTRGDEDSRRLMSTSLGIECARALWNSGERADNHFFVC